MRKTWHFFFPGSGLSGGTHQDQAPELVIEWLGENGRLIQRRTLRAGRPFALESGDRHYRATSQIIDLETGEVAFRVWKLGRIQPFSKGVEVSPVGTLRPGQKASLAEPTPPIHALRLVSVRRPKNT